MSSSHETARSQHAAGMWVQWVWVGCEELQVSSHLQSCSSSFTTLVSMGGFILRLSGMKRDSQYFYFTMVTGVVTDPIQLLMLSYQDLKVLKDDSKFPSKHLSYYSNNYMDFAQALRWKGSRKVRHIIEHCEFTTQSKIIGN